MQNTTNTTTTGNNHAKFLGVTPIDERKRFIRFLNQSGFTIQEIRSVYPTMSRERIKQAIKRKMV